MADKCDITLPAHSMADITNQSQTSSLAEWGWGRRVKKKARSSPTPAVSCEGSAISETSGFTLSPHFFFLKKGRDNLFGEL